MNNNISNKKNLADNEQDIGYKINTELFQAANASIVFNLDDFLLPDTKKKFKV